MNDKIIKIDLTKLSEIKYRYITQCIESLRYVVNKNMQLIKRNKYLANADWIFIEKNFQIKR